MKLVKSLLLSAGVVALGTTFAFGGGHSYSGPDLSGQKMTIFGPWLAPQDDQFRKVIKAFTDATGAEVEYAGSDSFEQQITIDVKAGSPPNLAIFPQPGLAANVAAMGGLTPLGSEMQDWVLNNYAAGQSWIDLGAFLAPSEKQQIVKSHLFYH